MGEKMLLVEFAVLCKKYTGYFRILLKVALIKGDLFSFSCTSLRVYSQVSVKYYRINFCSRLANASDAMVFKGGINFASRWPDELFKFHYGGSRVWPPYVETIHAYSLSRTDIEKRKSDTNYTDTISMNNESSYTFVSEIIFVR